MTDPKTVRAVVYFVGSGALLGLLLLAALIGYGVPAENVAVVGTIAGNFTGGLVALLVSTRSSDTPAPVTVENTAKDPVPVAEAPAAPALRAAGTRPVQSRQVQ